MKNVEMCLKMGILFGAGAISKITIISEIFKLAPRASRMSPRASKMSPRVSKITKNHDSDLPKSRKQIH